MGEKRLQYPPNFGGSIKIFLEFNPPPEAQVPEAHKTFVGTRGLMMGSADKKVLVSMPSTDSTTGQLLIYPYNYYCEAEPLKLLEVPQRFGAILKFMPPEDAVLTTEEQACVDQLGRHWESTGDHIGVVFTTKKGGEQTRFSVKRPLDWFLFIAHAYDLNWLEI